MKPKVLITNQFLKPLIELISSSVDVIHYWEVDKEYSALNEVRGVISSVWDAIDAKFMGSLPKLEIIAHLAAGIDSIDLEEAKRRKIIVTNTPDIVTDDTADLAIGMMITLARNIVINDKYVKSSLWGKKPYSLSMSLKNKKVGIVGLGRIGLEIAKRSEAFNLKIFYWGREKKNNVNYKFIDNLIELAQEVDFLIVSCAGTSQTTNLINHEVLSALGENSFLINISRGFVVKQDDLIRALQDNIIAGAGLDVFLNEPHVPSQLFDMPNVILQPHAGSSTQESRSEMFKLTANNILAYFQNGFALTPV